MYSDEDHSIGGIAALNTEEMESEPDLIEGVDEDGNQVLLQVVRYFFYNGDEYVVLGDAQMDDECDCGCEACAHAEDCEHDEDEDYEPSLYIMKVVETEENGEEMEEFVPIEDEELLEALIEVVQTEFDSEEEEEEEEAEEASKD